MPDRTFKQYDLLVCDSCGREWFGAGGEAQARDHARQSGHQVRLEIHVRETLNAVAGWQQPLAVPQVSLTEAQQRLSRERGMARLKRTGAPL